MSRLTKKHCWYRDCDTDSQSHPERTLFQFPKDEDRARRWSELGAVDPIAESGGPRFMCELHFSRIYHCFSARRKMLLNTAVPYRYGTDGDSEDVEQVQSTNQSSVEEHLEVDEFEILDDNQVGNENSLSEIIFMEDLADAEHTRSPDPEIRQQPVATTPKIPIKAQLLNVEKLPTLVTSSSGTETGSMKNIILRKIKLKKRPSAANIVEGRTSASPKILKVESVEATVSSSPKTKLESPKPTKSSPVISTKSSPVKAEKKSDLISEFIFKGEEYVQMPKRLYVAETHELKQQIEQISAEKSKMAKQLDYYRNIVSDMKALVQGIDEDDDD